MSSPGAEGAWAVNESGGVRCPCLARIARGRQGSGKAWAVTGGYDGGGGLRELEIESEGGRQDCENASTPGGFWVGVIV